MAAAEQPKRPWRRKTSGTKQILTPIQELRRVALYEMFVAQEIIDENSNNPENSADLCGPQASVSSLRKMATNDADTLESLQDALDSVRGAMALAGFGLELREKLKREDASRFDLVTNILPGLWCGGWAALNDDAFVLKQKKITHVLSVHSSETQRRLPAFIKGTMLVSVDDNDDADLLKHFPTVCDFISKARAEGGSVYVHCGAGISRAPTCCTAYVMKTGNLQVRSALALVKKHRKNARPNPGFLRQLSEWEKAVVNSVVVASQDSKEAAFKDERVTS
mmetsp:Transcript_16685/g.34020  ORF Transcript_16685/g.34020 Transcript_16685/m.34020 type:complete len:280 (-) Transcript_16685:39-878(-)